MKAVLAPITAEDLPAVSAFLHEQLNPRVQELEWTQALRVPWDVPQPNHYDVHPASCRGRLCVLRIGRYPRPSTGERRT